LLAVLASAAMILASACVARGPYAHRATTQKACDGFSFVACGRVSLYDWIALRGDATKLFEWAKRRGTPEAWDHYLRIFSTGERAAIAKVERENAAYAVAVRVDQSPAYRSFLAAYPQSRHAADVRTRLEKAAFREAEAAGREDVWRAYVREFGATGRAREAFMRIEKLHRDAAGKAKTPQQMLRYTRLYPRGDGASSIRALAAPLVAERALATRSPGIARFYLKAFPEGAHAAQISPVAASLPAAAPLTVTEVESIAFGAPLLRRLACREKQVARLASLSDPFTLQADELRQKIDELSRVDVLRLNKLEVPPWCADATLPSPSGPMIALLRMMFPLQNAVLSAATMAHQVGAHAAELEKTEQGARQIIAKADVFEQRWQALGTPEELRDVQLNASKLGEHVRDRAGALAKATREIERQLHAMLGDAFDSFVFTALAIVLPGSAP
jgi:hypothetical protein